MTHLISRVLHHLEDPSSLWHGWRDGSGRSRLVIWTQGNRFRTKRHSGHLVSARPVGAGLLGGIARRRLGDLGADNVGEQHSLTS